MHWEYCFETGKFDELEDFTDRLDAVGREGWEAVGMSENDDDFTVLMKRVLKAAVGVGDVDVHGRTAENDVTVRSKPS